MGKSVVAQGGMADVCGNRGENTFTPGVGTRTPIGTGNVVPKRDGSGKAKGMQDWAKGDKPK